MKDVKFDQILFGGDYNPDQWLDHPEILDQDIELLKKAKINTVSLGIFAWSMLEPEEGIYNFDWMEQVINRLYENGISVDLATPSGARPKWLAEKYPEVLRVDENRVKQLYGFRHNHCPSSPVYRAKVRQMNMKLAEHFDAHPGVILWHLSNEYGGECHCELCQKAFRKWTKNRYGTIEKVNRAWNTSFWSHQYQNFDQIESPSPIGEDKLQGLNLDWRRFVTDQVADFIHEEIRALRDAGAVKPVTTNFMYHFNDYNYHRLAKELDIISWDNYPKWHKGDNAIIAVDSAMQHDVMRTLLKKPYLLMESSPGPTNWVPVSKLTRPGMVEQAGIQALAHGSDSVMYFQIRKSRGGFEKFHGAVIDHYGKEDDRMFQECAQLGKHLELITEINHTEILAEVAVLYDWENRWAMEASMGPRNENLYYKEAMEKSYQAFRTQGLNVDMIDMEQSLDGYKIVAAPMLYMFRAGFEKKVRKYVEEGGIFILTYWSGVADENDLCFLGGTPHDLMDVMGLRSTEIDALYEGEKNLMCADDAGDSDHGLNKQYECEHLCQLVKVSTAKPLLFYGKEFYAGTPALTVNEYGKGRAYYMGADAEFDLYRDLYRNLIDRAGIRRPFNMEIPRGIEVSTRQSEDYIYIFIQNYNEEDFELGDLLDTGKYDVLYGSEQYHLSSTSSLILREKR